jgi:hypothetical protein
MTQPMRPCLHTEQEIFKTALRVLADCNRGDRAAHQDLAVLRRAAPGCEHMSANELACKVILGLSPACFSSSVN